MLFAATTKLTSDIHSPMRQGSVSYWQMLTPLWVTPIVSASFSCLLNLWFHPVFCGFMKWFQALLNPGTKFKAGDERWSYALQTPEPAVCFALCCGRSSDPAVISQSLLS
jgi:hypothetical protein